MNEYIETLKNEHKVVKAGFAKVKEQGLVTEEAKKTLFGIKEALIAHLKKEDEKLYPALDDAGKTDERIKSICDRFASEMKALTPDVLAFFQKYDDNPDEPGFAGDIAKIMAVLDDRIRKEEMILYPEYEKIAA